MEKPEIIALYLPQYHPTEHNDAWWGKGFTEWTNVGKAKPLFKDHYQPKVPADLGYYDLRIKEVRESQASLARKYGISAFCYYHYWFGNGRQELELPFNEVVESGEPDLPFCLCWANESWHKKFWTDFGSAEKKMLAEQLYPGDDDIDMHFYSLLNAFKDNRYYKVEGKNLFMIYKPFNYPAVSRFIERWQTLAKKNGMPQFLFIAQIQENFTEDNVNHILQLGFDMVNLVELYDAPQRMIYNLNWFSRSILRLRRFISHNISGSPEYYEYSSLINNLVSDINKREECIPTLIPNWDHTPRSGSNGLVFHNSTPDKFYDHVNHTLKLISGKQNKLIFLKSWNEWGEGNYMEPDLKFGKGFLESLYKSLIENSQY